MPQRGPSVSPGASPHRTGRAVGQLRKGAVKPLPVFPSNSVSVSTSTPDWKGLELQKGAGRSGHSLVGGGWTLSWEETYSAVRGPWAGARTSCSRQGAPGAAPCSSQEGTLQPTRARSLQPAHPPREITHSNHWWT